MNAEIDQATPVLYDALVNNENLPLVRADLWDTTAAGVEKLKLVIELTNANITSMMLKLPDTRIPKFANFTLTTEIMFVYQRIAWSWVSGNITSSDDWQFRR